MRPLTLRVGAYLLLTALFLICLPLPGLPRALPSATSLEPACVSGSALCAPCCYRVLTSGRVEGDAISFGWADIDYYCIDGSRCTYHYDVFCMLGNCTVQVTTTNCNL
jgi:hypothetical protein